MMSFNLFVSHKKWYKLHAKKRKRFMVQKNSHCGLCLKSVCTRVHVIGSGEETVEEKKFIGLAIESHPIKSPKSSVGRWSWPFPAIALAGCTGLNPHAECTGPGFVLRGRFGIPQDWKKYLVSISRNDFLQILIDRIREFHLRSFSFHKKSFLFHDKSKEET